MPIGTRCHSYIAFGVRKAVYFLESAAKGIWWYPFVKSSFPKYCGLELPIRVISSLMRGNGHPLLWSN